MSVADRRVLMVAYHYPPIRGSSGFQRTLAFSRYLAEHGWRATVLTVATRAYEQVSDDNVGLVPPHVDVVRVPALDTARHLSVRGRYLDALALPDRWQSWIPGGVLAGLWTIWRQRPAVIFSTFPVASAQFIGLALRRLTGLPWVADLRDPMDQTTYPANPRVRRAFRWVEERIFREAQAVLVTTPGTASLYRERYGDLAAGKLVVIPNGFDPDAFAAAGTPAPTTPVRGGNGGLLLLHSGLLYPRERDPRPFFAALRRLRSESPDLLAGVRIVFRATGHDGYYAPLLREAGLDDLISLAPPVPYAEALRETLAADSLLVFQASNCDRQIPAKAYECLYAGRPILALTTPGGDTGQLLRSMGVEAIATLEDEAAILPVLRAFLTQLRAGAAVRPDAARVACLSRRAGTAQLAGVLDRLVAPGTPAVVARG